MSSHFGSSLARDTHRTDGTVVTERRQSLSSARRRSSRDVRLVGCAVGVLELTLIRTSGRRAADSASPMRALLARRSSDRHPRATRRTGRVLRCCCTPRRPCETGSPIRVGRRSDSFARHVSVRHLRPAVQATSVEDRMVVLPPHDDEVDVADQGRRRVRDLVPRSRWRSSMQWSSVVSVSLGVVIGLLVDAVGPAERRLDHHLCFHHVVVPLHALFVPRRVSVGRRACRDAMEHD